jgi:hypothetical protein
VELEAVIQELGETEIDGDASVPFLGETITVGPGERLDQGGLPVIDVAGGPEDDVVHTVMLHTSSWPSSADVDWDHLVVRARPAKLAG